MAPIRLCSHPNPLSSTFPFSSFVQKQSVLRLLQQCHHHLSVAHARAGSHLEQLVPFSNRLLVICVARCLAGWSIY